MNKEKYLERIGIDVADIGNELESLKSLQRKHLLNIPFENLDIHWKRPITLDLGNFYSKITENKRGGFCYELNGLFYELLLEIGFQGKMISARVSKGENAIGEEFDHLAILVKIFDEEFLVDVGFGDFAAEPLKFVLEIEQSDKNGTFLIRKFDEEYFEVVKKDGDTWQSEYIFKDIKRELSEFSQMCIFHQTSAESHFTQRKICSIMTVEGRKTLTDRKFIETKHGQKIQEEIGSESDFDELLLSEFGIKR